MGLIYDSYHPYAKKVVNYLTVHIGLILNQWISIFSDTSHFHEFIKVNRLPQMANRI